MHKMVIGLTLTAALVASTAGSAAPARAENRFLLLYSGPKGTGQYTPVTAEPRECHQMTRQLRGRSAWNLSKYIAALYENPNCGGHPTVLVMPRGHEPNFDTTVRSISFEEFE